MASEFNLSQLSMVINAMARSLTHDWEAVGGGGEGKGDRKSSRDL